MRSAKAPEVAVYPIRIQRAKLNRLHEIAAAEHRTTVQKLRLMIEQEIARADAEVEAA